MLAVNPSLEYIAALYGIMKLGAVPVPCFPPLRPKELDRFHAITVDCAPKGIVIDEMYREPIEALQVRLYSPPTSNRSSFTPSSGGCGPTKSDSVSTTLERHRADPVHVRLDWSSKGVCLTHDNLVSNCEALGRNMGDDPTGSASPGYRRITTWG